MQHLARAAQQRARKSFLPSSCLLRASANSQLLPAPMSNSRSFHTSTLRQRSVTDERQALPLGGFYEDLLATPIPRSSRANPDLPGFVQTGGDETKEQRAAKLFGNIHGSGYERRMPEQPGGVWKTINGVPIPPRPLEPDNCCMSGCMHCVWDDFRDDVESWVARLNKAQAKARGSSMTGSPKADMHRPEVADASTSMDDDGGGSEGLWDSPGTPDTEADDLFQGIPVGIREFMATEKRIRDRKKERTKGKKKKET